MTDPRMIPARAFLAAVIVGAAVFERWHATRHARAWIVRAWVIVGWLILVPLAVYLCAPTPGGAP